MSEVKANSTNTNGLVEALNRVQAVIEFELDGTIIHANENFLNTGYKLEEIQGKHPGFSATPTTQVLRST